MDDPGMWKEAAKWLWGVLVPVGAYIWNKQDKRIDAMEQKMYSKEDARERRESVDETLEARRQDVIALHNKIDARAEKLDDKIDHVLVQMNAGFSDIKDLLLRR